MTTFQKRVATAALLGVVLLGLGAGTAQAQFRVRQWGVYAPGINPNAPFYNPAQPFQYVAPGVSLQSALINQVNYGRAISAVPPWVYGYNPYPPINIGPAYQSPGYGGYGGYGIPSYSPFLSTGYGGGGYPGYGSSLGTTGYGSSLSTGYNPYSSYISPTGGALMGAADVLFADGRFMNDVEKARMLRTQWKVAELDYQKKYFDYKEYVRTNTPSYAKLQEELNENVLRRIQKMASTGEVMNGSALNILLKNFATNLGKKAPELELEVPENVLNKINVTTRGGNMGLLRDGGELNWPDALVELAPREPKDVKREINVQAKELFRQAEQTGKVDGATARDLKTNINLLRERLVNNTNNISTDSWAAAKRFLSDLEDAVRAAERGDAPNFFAFQKFAKGGKHTVREVIDFMNSRGLTFAPAVEGDQGAYQSLYQSMAAYNMAMNEHQPRGGSGVSTPR